MAFLLLVVFPLGLTTGTVAWTIFRQGGFGSLLFSMMIATLGGVVGFFAGPALFSGSPGPLAGGLGAIVGSLLTAGLETLVRWHSPLNVAGGRGAPPTTTRPNASRP